MNTLFIGKNFVELPEVDSTNSFAAELLSMEPPEGTVVFTSNQTSGRGQQGNRWLSEPGKNIALTLILYPRFMPSAKVFLLNKMLSCALYDAVSAILPQAEVHIKWPNDLLVNGRKVAGMLVENHLERGGVASSLVGLGLNVNQRKFPEKEYGKASSLAIASDREWDLRNVTQLLLQQLEARYLAIKAGRFEQTERDYLKHLFAYQEDVEVKIEGEHEVVHLVGVDVHGRLAVQRDGKMEYFGVKEVAFCL